MTAPQPSQEVPQSVLPRYPALLPLLIAALLALIGVGTWPYSYYVFMRLVLTITAVFIAVHSVRSEKLGWLALAIPMGIIWAPAPWFKFPAAVWSVLDLVLAGVLVVAAFLIRPPVKTVDQNGEKITRWEWWKIALLVYIAGFLMLGAAVYGSHNGNPDCVVEYDRSGAYCG